MKKEKWILFLIFTIILCISIFLFSYGSDFYWHLKIGEYISSHHKIPFTDIFSWYASSNHLPWISHEWLFEVFIYQFFHLGRQIGVFLYVLFTLILISIILWKQNEKIFLKYPFQTILWGIVGMLVFANKTMPRPHLLSYLFFAITLYLSYDTLQNKNSKKIYFTPLISLLWSNFHGGSSNLSYLIYGVFLCLSFFSFTKGNLKNSSLSRKQQKKYLYAFVTSILSICINPHGIKMLIYPYINMTYKVMLDCIEEWQVLSLTTIDGIFYFLFILFVFFKIFSSKKEHQILDLLLLSLFTILGIKSTRFIPYFFIICTAILPKYWKDSNIKVELLPILISLFLIIPSFYFTLYQKPEFSLVSEEMIEYLKKEKTVLYNSYELGGYLIYQDIPVFIDGRADLYIDTILCDVCEIEQGQNPELLNNYSFDTFLVRNHSKLESYLSKNTKYQLKLKDKKNSLYILK